MRGRGVEETSCREERVDRARERRGFRVKIIEKKSAGRWWNEESNGADGKSHGEWRAGGLSEVGQFSNGRKSTDWTGY